MIPDAEDVEAHVERRFEEEAEDEHKEAGDDAKENEPPYDRDSDVEEGKLHYRDHVCIV